MTLSDVISGTITTQNLVPAGAATAGSAVEIDCSDISTLLVQTTGTYTGALSLQTTVDGTNWVTVGGTPFLNLNTGVALATITSALQSIFAIDTTAYLKTRITGLAAMTGTVTVKISGEQQSGVASNTYSIPAGTNSIGTVVLGSPATATTTSITKAEDAVHATGDSGSMSLGVRYETAGTAPTSAANDYGFMQIDDLGKTVVMPFAPPINQQQVVTAAITTTADTQLFASAGAGTRNYITSIQVVNSSATATVVEIKDNTTAIARIYAPANGSNSYVFNTPLKGTAATVMNAACLTTATNTYVSAQGFKAL
jgi:hypothetical protein